MLVTERKSNRLINEKSPYLLQHAHNPVDWYPWGEEAFEKAKAEEKPVFLSIGYSTCHWCHVMERESFEDEEVAKVLNAHFVSVKVDREERPDVDHIYMTVCQVMTGQGGWPLTVIMTPDRKPFFAGTYFPKESKWGRPGLMDILTAIYQQWVSNRDKINESSEKITGAIRGQDRRLPQGELSREILDTTYSYLKNNFDSEYGGFGYAPKFPTPHKLMLLMRYWWRTGNGQALEMVEKTLTAMRSGGIYDHLGYGFSRYSTDEKWLAPHFEKMLYDNALLCYTYLEAYQCTGNTDFARVAEEIITYVLRDMTSPEGAFYSAEDADSEGVEGKFYVWSRDEIIKALGAEQGRLFADFYGVTPDGNFEHGKSILNNINRDMREFAQENGLNTEELRKTLKEGREKLFQLREKRVHPYKDDKILTSWNALMVVALAKAARTLQRPEYITAAEQALEFIFTRLLRDGRLYARYRDGDAAYPAYLDDYAYLLWAMVEMYQTTFGTGYLTRASLLTADMIRLFGDEERGGFYFYGNDSEELIARPKELYDGALPSGNSVAAYAILMLSRMTDNEGLSKLVENMFRVFGEEVEQHPWAYTFFLMAFDYYHMAPSQIIITGHQDDHDTQMMLQAVGTCFMPDTVVFYNNPINERCTAEVLPHLSRHQPVDNRATAYICENFACRTPISDVGEFINTLLHSDSQVNH